MLTGAKSLELERRVGNLDLTFFSKEGQAKKEYKCKNMNINYPVGDFLIRLKNAGMAGKSVVFVKKSKLIRAVADALKKEGFLDEIEEEKGVLLVKLSFRKKEPVLLNIRLVSKPGLRVYMNVEELIAKKGPSVVILSTPLGIMSAKDAIKKEVGGEVIAEVL
jgi:small subunit ribosomal protein S8